MAPLVELEKNQGIAIVTINNPPMNVLSAQVTKELGQAFAEIAKDPDIIVAILTGAGEKAFMAGADIKEFPSLMDMETEELKLKNQKTHKVLNEIENLPKPTIAMLNGITFGGGCELSLACDLRIAEEHVKLGLPEVKLGLFPGGGGTQRLSRLVGPAKAKELMFLGDPIMAEEAQNIGLINQVAQQGQGMEMALTIARKMARYSLHPLRSIKLAVNQGIDKSLDQGLELEAGLFADIFRTEDVKEGVQAFLEKREPRFTHQ
ncbi:enoyl-CoA hydratase [Halobacillus massiliensis]|uniref:enoyl-CoA hydratase n=1 Tax=Halobacillus massiliensis TaxID=1926286 RepID=UPI00117B7E19|nr:enoyl-CoA hydratase [Halobacillus massiliensis]